ncbi:Protein often found in Actinomycetes clustered with signal peptidase and/or RNaseHII [Pseudonocardia sp. Ae706_Ps2]|nr:Protein often found in Actinomycetes clustered with signal peptidase and/or RNaseHII [Pseudonocardia sp. Ae331_Ps2]OLM23729.1 Protein often found in Actinomycetes clustered with signal peptidase and/or RNaseHII [Pseudonocardia sp. Ae706_Ps2]
MGAVGDRHRRSGPVSAEDLEKYETEMELTLYKEYRDIVAQFSYVVETERRFYLANSVDVAPRNADGEVYFEVRMSDAWVWDMYRPARFVKNVRVVTFKDVNIEELDTPDLRLPDDDQFPG